MTYEEKILTYLDGSFTDDESAELLHQLSVSPEKRVVLEQHLQLRSVISQAGKPFAVPAAIEEQLAGRIPILAEYDRDLAAGGFIASNLAKESLFVRGTSAIRGFMATRSARIATGVVALLLLGTIFFANKTSDESLPSQTQISTPSSSAPLSTPSNDIANTASSQARNNSVLNAEKSSNDASSLSIASHRDAHMRVSTTKAANSNTNSRVASIKDKENVVVEKDNISNKATNTSAIDESSFVTITSVPTLRDASTSQIAMNNIGEPMRAVAFGKRVEYSNVPVLFRVDPLAFGQSYFRVKESDASTTTRLEYTPMLGVDFIASPYISFGGEFGSAAISHVLSHQVIDNSTGIMRVVTSNTIESSNEYYLRGLVRFTPNPYDMIRMEGSIGGGMSLEGTKSPMVVASLMGNYSFTEKLGVSLGLIFSGAFTQSNNEFQRINADLVPEGEPVGYVQQNTGASSLFVPSVTFRIGFRIKPW